MKDIIQESIVQVRRFHQNRKRYIAMLLVLALLTTLFVNWQLHGIGISMTAEYQCGMEEHEHTAACYEKVLTCGYVEGEPEDWNATPLPEDWDLDTSFGVDAEVSDEPEYEEQTVTEIVEEPHIHTDECYEERQVLDCLEEEHVHDDDCFDPETNELICDKFEHTHTDSCYTTERELVCGLEEGELVETPVEMTVQVPVERPVVITAPMAEPGVADTAPIHYHTDACYTEVLTCTKPEHHHTVECLSDPLEDVEDESDWLAKTDTNLTGAWPEDLVTVAKSQLGYEESVKNFQLDIEDGVTLRGYSRYGAWYGNKYGEWDVMFLSYCLHYAGVPQTVVPQRAGVLALRSDLRDSKYLQEADGSRAQPGDIVIYNTTVTETVAQDDTFDASISDSTADADTDFDDPYDIALFAADAAGSDSDAVRIGETGTVETGTREVSIETVGIVTEVDKEAGTLTVISGDVSGKVAEVQLTTADVTDVFDLNKAYTEQQKADAADADTVDDDGFSMRVEWIGEAQETAYPVMLAAVDYHDLQNYIDSSKSVFRKLEGDNWVDIKAGDTFEDGEAVQIKLEYSVPQSVISKDNPKLTYQLPNGLTLEKAKENGVIYQGEKAVGNYTISLDGKVEMTFTDADILNGAAFDGNFTFEAKVDASEVGSDGKVKFTDQLSMQIKKPSDIAVTKGLDTKGYAGFKSSNYADEEGNYYLRWYVEASTINGTNGTVRIGDLLNGDSTGSFAGGGYTQVLGSYVKDSVQVYKLAAGQSALSTAKLIPSTDYTLTVLNDGELARSLTVDGLLELSAGEKYILCYTTKVTVAEMNKCKNSQGRIYNKGFAGIENQPNVVTSGAKFITFNKRLEKDGVLNENGLIDWTITLKAPHSACSTFLRGYKITDAIPDGLTIEGEVTIKAGGKVVATMTAEDFQKDGYTVPDDSTSTTYTVTFSTTAPTSNGTVVNTATATKGEDTFTATKKLVFGVGTWTISKKHVQTTNGMAEWNITAENTLGSTDFELIDLMDTMDANGQRVNGIQHWIYLSELKQAVEDSLVLTLRDGTKVSYQEALDKGAMITINCYSDYGASKVVEDGVKAVGFRINIKNLAVKHLELKVTTHEERSNQSIGETWSYRNQASITGKTGWPSDKDTYTRYESFVKMVSTDGSSYNTGSTVDYDTVKNGRLRYRIGLVTDADQKEIKITDTLPDNVQYLPTETAVYVDNKKVTAAGDWSATCAADGVLTLTLKNYNSDHKQHTVEFRYEVDISADPTWQDWAVSKVEYKNKAEWGKETASTTTTVNRNTTEVKKTGDQIFDEKGNPTDRVKYTVYINPAAERLNNGEPLTLEDRLHVISGAGAYGDVSTVRFYQYQVVNGQPTIGAELPEGLCKILPAEEDSWLRVEVPDGQAIVMQYECEIDAGTSNAPELQNEIYLNGKRKDGISNEVKHDSSSASVSMGQLMLNKKDSYTGRLLKGATFRIEYYDTTNKNWVKWGERTTNDAGQILLGVTETGNNDTLRGDTLYRIQETDAPENYELDSTPHYVVFALKDKTFDEAYQAATGTDGNLTVDNETVEKDKVTQGSINATTVLDVTNTYNKLTVIKSWLDSQTMAATEAPVGEIQVQLYRIMEGSTEKKAVGALVTLNADNSWSYTWQGSDVSTEINGVNCYYMVEEVTTGDWTLVTGNNEGTVQTGKIYLWNYVHPGYELPSTGGSGTRPFALAGGALMGGAAWLLFRKRRKQDEEGV